MRRPLLILLLLCSTSFLCRAASDTLSVFFDLGKAELTPQATASIDDMIKKKLIRPGRSYAIIGYCDYIGSKRKNDSLSRQRAENVMAYLISKDFSIRDIEICIGKGKIVRPGGNNKEGYQADRKVLIARKDPEPPPPPPVATKPTKPVPAAKPEKHQLTEMAKMDVNQLVTLNRIYFEAGTRVLLESSKPQLDTLYQILKDNPKIKIQVEGHICCILSSPGDRPIKIFAKDKMNDPDAPFDVYEGGTPDLLSFARARVICNFLADKGIARSRIKYTGLGMSHNDAAKENSPEVEQHNRRVDIRIIEK